MAMGSRVRRRTWARALGRHLPVISAYEQRLSELHQELAELREYQMLWPPGHYHSPYPPIDEIRVRASSIFERDPLHLPGIDLQLDAQWRLFDQLCRTPDIAEVETPGFRYRSDNTLFPWSDAVFLHLMLRHLEPARLIEVGSGWSSACTLDTIQHQLGWKTRCTFIEPYPEKLQQVLTPGDAQHVEILLSPLQDVPLERFTELAASDVLFIDSTHVVRAGSDVNYLFFEILPALAPGVVVHLHDVFPSFEYPSQWIEEGRAWSEQYMLRAFLQYNNHYSICLWPHLLALVDRDRYADTYPSCLNNLGGSIWLQRTNT
jgi:hypothetical protein